VDRDQSRRRTVAAALPRAVRGRSLPAAAPTARIGPVRRSPSVRGTVVNPVISSLRACSAGRSAQLPVDQLDRGQARHHDAVALSTRMQIFVVIDQYLVRLRNIKQLFDNKIWDIDDINIE
jgi:hypothetical protein